MPNATAFTLTGPPTVPMGQQSGDITITLNGTWAGAQPLNIDLTEVDQTNMMFYKPGDAFPPTGNEIQLAQYGTRISWPVGDTATSKTFKIAIQTASEYPILADTPFFNGTFHIAAVSSSGNTSHVLTEPSNLAIKCIPKPLEIMRPAAYEIYQQSGGSADMIFTGYINTTGGTDPTAIEASLDNGGAAPYDGNTWTTILASPTATITGTAQNGGSNTTIKLAAGAPSSGLVGAVIKLTAGTGSGLTGVISAYNGTTKVATVYTDIYASGWGVTPDNTTQYTITNNPSGVSFIPFNINGTSLLWDGTHNPGYPVSTGSKLTAVPTGVYTVRVRWANDHSTTITIPGVSIGDVSASAFATPTAPTIFSVPYSLPTGGTTWNVGTLTSSNTGTVVATQGAYIQLDASASSVDNAYQWDTVTLTSGTGAGQADNVIVSYNGTTKIALVRNNWDVAYGIPASGTGFSLSSGRSNTAQAGGNATITLAAGASGTNDYYKGALINITGGTGSGQSAVILSGYNGTTKVASVSPNWKVVPTGATYNVAAIGDSNSLQYALHYAARGDVIVLTAGACYVANTLGNGSVGSGTTGGLGSGSNGSTTSVIPLRLEAKAGTGDIYITTSAYGSLPVEGHRVDLTDVTSMATIRAYMDLTYGTNPNGYGCLMSIGAASNYRFVGINFQALHTCYNMMWLGLTAPSWDEDINNSGITMLAATTSGDLPANITIDRCVMQQSNDYAQLQAHVLMNGAYIACVDSHLSGAHSTAEANCFFCWNGTGPFKIVNNYLDSLASQAIFGANDPIIPNLVPSDIEFVGNRCVKPLNHFPNDASYDGMAWDIKNHFELKCGQRVLVQGNIFEHNFGESMGQRATCITLTPRNSGGAAPFSVVQDVLIRDNIIDGCGIVFHITGPDPHEGWLHTGTKATRRIQITNNLAINISDYFTYVGSNGLNNQSMWISGYPRDDGGPVDLNINHNTFLLGPMVLDQEVSFNTVTGLATTLNPHQLQEGQKIAFRGNVPSPLVAYSGATYYWVHVVDPYTFYVHDAIDYYGAYRYIRNPDKPGSAPTFPTSPVIPTTNPSGCYLRQRFALNSLVVDQSPPAAVNWNLNDNLVEATYYGFFTSGHGPGVDVLDSQTDNLVCKGNLFINHTNDSASIAAVPSGTNYNVNSSGSLDAITAPVFNDYLNGDYSLSILSFYKGQASDSTDPGVDWTALTTETQNTLSGITTGGGGGGGGPINLHGLLTGGRLANVGISSGGGL